MIHCWRWRLVKAGCWSCLKMPGPRMTLSGLRPVLVMEPECACSDCLYRDRVCSTRVLSPATNDCKLGWNLFSYPGATLTYPTHLYDELTDGQTVLDPNLTWRRESRDSDLVTCDCELSGHVPRDMSKLKSLHSRGHVAANTNLWPDSPRESEQTKITSVFLPSWIVF